MDVFLVFRTGRVNSDEERVVIRHIVDMYYNFAANSTAVYGNVTIDRFGADDFKILEINAPNDYQVKQLDEGFGQVQFWHDIEERFASGATSRESSFVILTALLAIVMVVCK